MTRTLSIFLPSLEGGGAERVATILANSLSHMGYSVDMVLVAANGPFLESLSPDVNIVDLGATRVLASIPALVEYLRSRRPHALLATLDHTCVAAIIAKRLSGSNTRVVVRLANVLSTSIAQSRVLRSRLVLWPLIKLLYRRADKVIAVSDGVAKDAMRFAAIPPERLVVINNPVPTDHIQHLTKDSVELPSIFVPNEPVVLAAGRLSPQKDFRTLIRAFAKVRVHRNARLVILGEGEQREELERLVTDLGLKPYVSLPGFVKNPYAFMARSAVFVLSSRWEGFPNVLVEAMAVGVPVVATDCMAGPAEILENGRYGQLVPVGDVDAMAAAIIRELDLGPGPREELQLRAKDFSPVKIASEYLQVLIDEVQDDDIPGIREP